MKRLWFSIALLLALAVVAGSAVPARADAPITITSSKFTNNFRKNLLFQVAAQSSAKITQVALFVQVDGVASSSRFVPDFEPGTEIQATYTWDLGMNYVPPGVTGEYWWSLQDGAGNSLESSKQSFRVDDPAHNWSKLSNDKLALYWYAGGSSFGQALFDKAVQSMSYLQQDTGVTVDHPIQIFIYGDRKAFFDALETGATEWTGGRAFPDYRIILIDVAPSELEWGKGATTHELTHQVIHQAISSPLGDMAMPHWMDEGLAVYYEDPGKIDSQFTVPLNQAVSADTLLRVRSLSGSFPADPRQANLAYGESWSVVDFIIRQYGRPKLAQLLQAFKAGMFYDDALQKVLGVDTDGLETQWRKDIGAQPRVYATQPAGKPTAFPTFGLSTDLTSVPASAPAATVTPVSVALGATAAAPSTRSPSTPASPFANLCGGVFGLLALGIFGAALRQRMS